MKYQLYELHLVSTKGVEIDSLLLYQFHSMCEQVNDNKYLSTFNCNH